MNPELIVYLIAVLIDKGVPALAGLITAWQKVNPTLTDIEALRSLPIDPDAPRKEV
jgi:hypothetical protein